tara:strand:- start:387 stop:536 length:150 start_codon:yes stop_codon:yes gene_type:complete
MLAGLKGTEMAAKIAAGIPDVGFEADLRNLRDDRVTGAELEEKWQTKVA